MNRQTRRYSSSTESESRSISRSRTESRSRSRARTTTRSRSSSPQSRRSTSSYTSKKYDTYTKKTSAGTKTNQPPVRISKASSETSVINRRQKVAVAVRRQPVRNAQPRPQTEQVSQTAMRVMSAQRLKNNDLNNRLKELMKEMEKIKEENKLLQRVHKREEKALKNLETQEHDVARMIRNHLEEANSLKETIKQIKNENKKLSSTLIDKDEEIRAMRKKNDEMKKILNDKKLLDSVELTKKLEACERDLSDFKTKYAQMERKIEMMEKNHKHELGVEIAHHREVQKQLQKLTDENKDLKQTIQEKEKALDIANIYSNRMISQTPGWKASTQSLNQPSDSPRDSSRQTRRAKKEAGVNSKPPRPVIKEADDIDSERSYQAEMEAKLEREKEEAARRQKEYEAEIKRKREAEEKERKKEESKRLEAERLRREKANLEEEYKKKSIEEEEKRRLEKQRLEEEDRKKRWVSENPIDKLKEGKNKEDDSKKDELLAKLSLIDSKKQDDSIFKLTSVDEPKKSVKPNNDPKDDLLSKLFGAETKKDDLFLDLKPKETNKISQMPWEAQEISFNAKKTSGPTQLNGFREQKSDNHIDFFSKLNSNTKPPHTGLNGGLSRPKLDNKLLFPDIHKSNNFVEDIEEIVL